jgi:dethiobiotin synthetase
MAGYLHNDVYDLGLTELDLDANVLHILSQQPATYAEVTTYTLGNKASPTVGAPEAGNPDGRQVTVSAITDGSVTATGTATHWALVDTSGSRLLATQALASSQGVTQGNTFTLTSFTIRIPAPTA